MTELEFRSLVEPRLERYFNLYPEQKAHAINSNGKKTLKRIDLIIEYKFDSRFVFGIEFKTNGKKTGKDLAAFINQAKGYAALKWNFHTNAKQWGKVPVFICPPLSGNYLEYIDGNGFLHDATQHQHHNVNSFIAGIGQHPIGETRYRIGHDGKSKFLRLIFNNEIVWQELEYQGATNDGIYESACKRLFRDCVYYRTKSVGIVSTAKKQDNA